MNIYKIATQMLEVTQYLLINLHCSTTTANKNVEKCIIKYQVT